MFITLSRVTLAILCRQGFRVFLFLAILLKIGEKFACMHAYMNFVYEQLIEN